jgi:type IX secretion system PorP/SprF family membrane protein
MKREHFLILVVLFFCQSGFGQDQTNFTHFFLNPYLINPSYVGVDGRASLSITYRKQWATIKDGPVLGNVTFQSPLSRRVSLGLSITDDKRGLLANTGAMLTFGYNIPLGPQSFFRFGISGGVATNTVDVEKLADLNDPAVANILENNLSVQGNTGISFHLHTFHAGVSLPVIFQPAYFSQDAFSVTEIKPFENIIFQFSNRFYFNNDRNIFEPYAVYRMSQNLPAQYEIAGIIHLSHVLWFGGSFKEDFGISALGGVKIKNALAIGASYGLKTSGDNELNSPTYEISLNILFGKHRKEIPMYSFVDTEKEKIKKGTGKSASELLAEKRRQEELIAKKKQMDLAKKQEEELAKQQQQQVLAQQQEPVDQVVPPVTQPQVTQQQVAQQQAAQQQAEVVRKQQAEALLVQQQLAARKQQEEVVRKQQEEVVRKQQEEVVRKQQEEVARKQQEEVARKQQEEVVRKQQAEAVKQQEELLARKQQEELAKKQANPVVVQQQPDPVYTSTIRQDSIMLKHKPRFTQIDESMEVLKIEITEHNDEDELERLSRIKLHQQDPDESHDGQVVHPNSDRHEYVKRGKHKQELDDSNYLVTGVFKGESQARNFTEGLAKLGFTANYGHSSEKKVWFVYLVKTNNINVLRQQRDKFRKMKIFRDAWIVTVTP